MNVKRTKRRSGRVKPQFVEVSVRPAPDGGEVLARLEAFSPLGAWEEESTLHLYWQAESWCAPALQAMREAIADLGADPHAAEIIVSRLEDCDWDATWRQSTMPVRIGRRIVIRQSWNPVSAADTDIVLVIDPKRAFGSGFHATTQLMIESLEDQVRGGESVADVGTGTGILAMIARRLGAATVIGIDRDPDSVAFAREYARRNGIRSGLRFLLAPLEDLPEMNMDLVLANLDRSTLLDHAGKLARLLREGGILLVTGILREDEDDVRKAFSPKGVRSAGRKARGDWVLLEMLRE